MARQPNIVLIGMPGAGKSTVGQLLAARLQRPFIDTDALLAQRHGMPLAELLQLHGLVGFIEREEQILVDLDVQGAVIATGGSVVYSAPGMAALRQAGVLVLLDCPSAVLAQRLGDPAARGMVIAPGQSLQDLLRERQPLYRRHADLSVCCDGDPAAVAAAVQAAGNF